MSKIIIGIHGLGNKPPKATLEKWWLEAIKEGFVTHGFSTDIPKFEMVYWADIIYDKPLDGKIRDENDPYYLDEWYAPAIHSFKVVKHNIRKRILDFIKRILDKVLLEKDYSIKYPLITDKFIHRYFKDFEDYYSNELVHNNSTTIREIIRERTASVIKKYKNDEIFIVAHSMGSIIAYDVLSLLIPEISVDTFVTIGSPLGLPVVKSKIITERNLIVGDTCVLPAPPGIKRSWYNFADLEDSVALNYDLSDDFTANENGVTVKDYIVTNNYVLNNIRNPHKSFGYLRTYEFSSVLNEFIEIKKITPIQKVFKLFKEKIIQIGKH